MIACQLGENFLEGAYPCQTDETFPLAGGGRGVTSTAATPTSSQGRPGLGAHGPPAPPRSSRVVCVCEQGDWSTGHRVPCCAGEAEAGRVRPPPSPLVLSLPPIAPSGPRDTALVGVSLVSGSAVASLPSCLPAPLDIRLTVPGKRGGGRPTVPTSHYQGAPSRLCCREPKLSRTVSGAVLGRPHLCRPRKGRSHQDHVP